MHQPLAAATQGGGDRFFLSANDDGGEASLRLSMVLGEHMLRETAFTQEQREALRLEYRMLAALHERATDQLAVAEKLRSMEAALTDLQGRAAGLQARAAAVEDAPLPQAAAVPAAPLEEASSDWGGTVCCWRWYCFWPAGCTGGSAKPGTRTTLVFCMPNLWWMRRVRLN